MGIQTWSSSKAAEVPRDLETLSCGWWWRSSSSSSPPSPCLHACMKRACTEIFVLRGFWWCKTFPWGLGYVGVCKIDSWEAELELRAMACLCGAFGRATSCGKPGCVFSSRSYWAGKTELVFSFSFFQSFFLFTGFFWSRLRKGVHIWKVSCLYPAIPDEIGVVPPAHPLVWTNC